MSILIIGRTELLLFEFIQASEAVCPKEHVSAVGSTQGFGFDSKAFSSYVWHIQI